MNKGILLPVYYREKKTQSIVNLLRQRAEDEEYFYNLQGLCVLWDVGTEESSILSEETIEPGGETRVTKNEFWKKGFKKIDFINNTFQEYLSPLLKQKGLELYYSKSIPKDIDNYFDGTVRWGFRLENYIKNFRRGISEDSRRAGGIMSLVGIEASVRNIVIIDSGKKSSYSLSISFHVCLHSVGHLEHLKIPSHGVGAEFFLEEIFAILENNNFGDIAFQDWKERLIWFCKMINKHQDTLFNPISSSLTKAVFNSIRARAIKVEN